MAWFGLLIPDKRAKIITETADVIAAVSIEGLVGTAAAFDIDIHNARPHKGQIKAGFHGLTNFGSRKFLLGIGDFKINPF